MAHGECFETFKVSRHVPEELVLVADGAVLTAHARDDDNGCGGGFFLHAEIMTQLTRLVLRRALGRLL